MPFQEEMKTIFCTGYPQGLVYGILIANRPIPKDRYRAVKALRRIELRLRLGPSINASIVDPDLLVKAFAFAFRVHVFKIIERGMDEPAFERIHGFE